MNDDKTHFDPSHPIEPELEARVVAWVLGEASPFEAAELERRCAIEPELAIFKRRTEAVHGLLGEAARPADVAWRLAPERRAALLEKLREGENHLAGADGAGAGPGAAGKVAVLPVGTRRAGTWSAWVMPLAACLALGGLLAAVVLPTVGKVRGTARGPAQALADALEPMELAEGQASLQVMRQDPRVVQTESVVDSTVRSAGIGEVRVLEWAEPSVGTGSKQPPQAAYGIESRTSGTDHRWAANDSYALRVPAAASAPATPAAPAAAPAPAQETAARAKSSVTAQTGTWRGAFDGGAGQAPQKLAETEGRLQGARERNRQGNAMGGAMLADNKATPLGTEVSGRKTSRDVSALQPGTPLAEEKSDQNDRASQVFFESLTATAGAKQEQTKLGRNELAKEQDAAPVVTSDTLTNVLAYNSALADGGKATDGLSDEAVVVAGKLVGALGDLPAVRPVLVAPADESLRAEIRTEAEAVSTFSLHVGDVSFQLAKAALERGEAPAPATIRPEEFYNAFDYGDPAPAAGEPVGCRIEQAAHPFLQQRNLVRIALRVPASGRGAGTPLDLTVLLDTSGSMEREDRAATVRAAVSSLTSLLGTQDRVTLIGFARQPRLLAENLPGDQAGPLTELAERTPAEGGTNLEEALRLAEELARRHGRTGAQSRIVLLTDGAANLGNADPARLAAQIESLRRQGVAFDACGVCADGLDDDMLESLTRKGDGRYLVLNSPEEADAGFARKLAGAFRPAAENVKVQVRFNPARVARYRLIGFEKHRLREEDFRDDRVDAAELASEEAAVALYQVEPLPGADLGELGEVAVRFRDPAKGEMTERSWTLAYEAQPPAFDRAPAALRLAGASALLAEKLRGGAPAGVIRLDELAPVVAGLRGAYAGDARVEDFVRMFDQTRRLTGE